MTINPSGATFGPGPPALSPAPAGGGLLTRKVRPPGLPSGIVARSRLDEHFADLLSTHNGIAVFAAAGSGKTVQAQMFSARYSWPLAWLTLDSQDSSGSRLTAYLARALASVSPAAEKAMAQAIAAGLTAPDVAATLAESLDDQPILVVLDGCERIASSPEALSVVQAFLEYLPPEARALVLSRDDLDLSMGRMLLDGRMARVGDEELALTIDEARAIASAQSRTDRDPAPLLDSTRGWMAGFVFEMRTDVRSHDGRQDLAQYLSQELFERLTTEEQQFLIKTSVLDAVTPRAAVALCGPQGYTLWRSLTKCHLPATTGADGALVYHPCFREFLQGRLDLEEPSALAELHQHHAQLLIQNGCYEDAVERLFMIGALDDAETAAEHAVHNLMERADWSTLLEWCDRLGEQRVRSRPLLVSATIKSLIGTCRTEEARELVRQLRRGDELTPVIEEDPGVIAQISWALRQCPSEVREVLADYQGTTHADAVKYELDVTMGSEAVSPPTRVGWPDVQRFLSWGLLIQGRLGALLEMLPDEGKWPPHTLTQTPHPIVGLLCRGEIAEAKRRLSALPDELIRRDANLSYHFALTMLNLFEGDEAALRIADEAATISRSRGLEFAPVFEILLGFVMIRLDRAEDALAVIAGALESAASRGQLAVVEWGQTFQGLALLRTGRPRQAQRLLRGCVARMKRAHRFLMLPLAATYRAAAELQLGSADSAERSAERAYDVCRQLGSLFLLEQALDDVPSLRQHLVASEPPEGRWHQIASSADARAASTAAGDHSGTVSVMHVQTLGGASDLYVDGVRAFVTRRKVVELAALLALHPEGLQRQRLKTLLFPEASQQRGGNYLRQIVHRLYKAAGLRLSRTHDGTVAWPEGLRIESTDGHVEQMIRRAEQASGGARLDQLLAALELVSGKYLEDCELDWAAARRFEFDVLVEDARVEAAELAYALGRSGDAGRLAAEVIASDPYHEPAYRVLMKVEEANGAPGGVIRIYQQLRDALGELGLEPDADTAAVVDRLRSKSADPGVLALTVRGR